MSEPETPRPDPVCVLHDGDEDKPMIYLADFENRRVFKCPKCSFENHRPILPPLTDHRSPGTPSHVSHASPPRQHPAEEL